MNLNELSIIVPVVLGVLGILAYFKKPIISGVKYIFRGKPMVITTDDKPQSYQWYFDKDSDKKTMILEGSFYITNRSNNDFIIKNVKIIGSEETGTIYVKDAEGRVQGQNVIKSNGVATFSIFFAIKTLEGAKENSPFMLDISIMDQRDNKYKIKNVVFKPR